MHECARIAWLKVEDDDGFESTDVESKEAANEVSVAHFSQMEGVGNWVGAPPLTVADLMRMNEEMKRGGH